MCAVGDGRDGKGGARVHLCVCVCVCMCVCVRACDELSVSLYLCKRSELSRDGAP